MKRKTVIGLLTLSMGATAAFAQTGAQSGTRYGHGEDSIKCLRNISIYTEYVKTNNFSDAYSPWKSVFEEAPVAQAGTYTNGARILRWLIANEKDATKKNAYFEELMKVYDQRLANLSTLNSYVKRPVSKGSIVGMKAHDYYANGCPDINVAYTLFNEAISSEKEKSDYYVLQEFMDLSARKLKSNESHKEQFIEDYLNASGYADLAYKAATKEGDKTNLKAAKENIDAYFINSGAATCDNLQSIYGPKVDQNKSNMDYLKQVISVMQLLGCTEQEAYFAASEAAHAIEPSAATAVGCGYMYYKKGDFDKCFQYFDQAIELEQDPTAKSDYLYKTAAILFSQKQLSKAKQYANRSISLNANNGNAYILIASMYASNPNWSDESALNKCTYFAVIDKLQKAKSVDPKVADKANELIRTYSKHTPKDADLFFLGLKKGDSVTIGGWIGETTTIR
ncbi:MAG: tetratricopeptide repeat protein [Phocaeicola sp.]